MHRQQSKQQRTGQGGGLSPYLTLAVLLATTLSAGVLGAESGGAVSFSALLGASIAARAGAQQLAVLQPLQTIEAHGWGLGALHAAPAWLESTALTCRPGYQRQALEVSTVQLPPAVACLGCLVPRAP